MQTYLTRKLKTYKLDIGFKRINGLDICIKTDVDLRVERAEKLIKEMNETNRKINRTISHWNDMINLMKLISRDIKEYERNRVTFVPMFPGAHFHVG